MRAGFRWLGWFERAAAAAKRLMRPLRGATLSMAAVAVLAFCLHQEGRAASLLTNGVTGRGTFGPSLGPRIPGDFGTLRTGPNSGSGDDSTGPAASSTSKPTKSTSKGGGNASSGSQSRAGFTLPAAGQRFVPDEVILSLAERAAGREGTIAATHSLQPLESFRVGLTGRLIYRWRITNGTSVAATIRSLARDTRVASAQPNFLYTVQQSVQGSTTPSDNSVSAGDPAQYAVQKLHLVEAHQLATGENVLVAVIDSGIDASHPDLEGVIAARLDLVGDDKPHSHGTGMAGAIASHGRLIGVAPRVRLLAVRAFGPASGSAEGTTFNILKGLDWSASQGARVVNMSFAGPRDPMLDQALAAARRKGMVLVAAAGNAGPKSPPLYPAADPNVIAVTATDADDKLFAEANQGNYIAVAAPGVDVLVPAPDQGYQMTSGTSVAAAQVSGVAALLIERDGRLDPDGVRKILLVTAHHLGPRPKDDQFGAGLADAYAATKSLLPKVTSGSGATH